MRKLSRVLQLLATPGALKGFLTWNIFSLAAFQMLQRLKSAGLEPATIIDIGANQGQFSFASHMTFPDAAIYPVEADSAVAEILRRNLPQDIASNLVVSAVGDYTGSASLYIHTDSQANSLLPTGHGRQHYFPDDSVVNTREVCIVTLDDLFGSTTLAQPVLLKIDVQGYEDRVLAGASKLLPYVNWVVLEMSFSKLYEGESGFTTILDRMMSLNFKFLRPLDFHLSGDGVGDIIEIDALFVNLDALSCN